MTESGTDAYRGLSFEEALRELEAIVQRMESETLSLEESLQLYEHGMLLARHCEGLLDKAELRIDELANLLENQGDTGEPDLLEPLQ